MTEDTLPYRTKCLPMKLNVTYLGREEFYPGEHMFEIHTDERPFVGMIKIKEIDTIPDFDPNQFKNHLQSYFNGLWQRKNDITVMKNG